MTASGTVGNKDQRLEVRMTLSERELINTAAGQSGGDLSSFVVSSLVEASRRLLADREVFTLSAAEKEAWEAVNRRPAKDLIGLRELMRRPSPFVD